MLTALVLLAAAALALDCSREQSSAVPAETVFLIHGLGRSRASLLVLASRLRSAGYRTVLVPYDPARLRLEDASEGLLTRVRARACGGRYHLIGHSLGGIIIRDAARRGYPEGLGRVVMLAPPNRPPELAARLKTNPLFRLIAGDSGRRLADPAFYARLPPPPGEFGVIAGDRGQRLTFDEPNDGVVTVAGARLSGMRDFRVVHHSHTFIMNGRDTFALIDGFLKEGLFP